MRTTTDVRALFNGFGVIGPGWFRRVDAVEKALETELEQIIEVEAVSSRNKPFECRNCPVASIALSVVPWAGLPPHRW